ncbi:GNAT family N-acetyltransferase [Treponema sp. R6D11]
MSDAFSWRKIKKSDFPRVEKLLMDAENNYVNASAKFLLQKEANVLIWVLGDKNGGIQAVILNWKNNILPVLCGYSGSLNDFNKEFLLSAKIHSVQGLKQEVMALEREITKNREPKDIIDYTLMSLDAPPKKKNTANSLNIKLITPKMTDIDAIAPLQAEYEKEEVLPKGSTFSPASSRVNTANILAKGQVLAAELDGRFIGKINVSAVSFSRYQVGGVYVYPEFRGRGIAGAMAYEFISSLILQGRGVTLFVRKSNISACRLYKSLGFKNINDYSIIYY